MTVLFLCPFGGAKSVIAASYFNRLAAAATLPFSAVAAAAETPYQSVPLPVADFLERQGFEVRAFKPRGVERADIRTATKIISIDCDLTEIDLAGASVERWDDVPRVSDDLPGSVAAIHAHVQALISQLNLRS
jgi:arsenate reductase